MNTPAENIPDPRKEEDQDEDGSEDITVPREIVPSPHPIIPPPERPLAARD